MYDKIVGNSFESLYKQAIKAINSSPDFICSPRGMKIKEILFATLVLENPRDRLAHSPARAMNYGFGVGEFFWYLTGRNDLESIQFYNKRMKLFSDDGKTLNSAYGHRMFGVHYEFPNQWEVAFEKLKKDSDTRQAVIHINFPRDIGKETKDFPCTMSLVFFIRDNKLYLKTHMRSNDIIWGTPYDIFSFTLFHELMYNRLHSYNESLEMGNYVHQADSLHLYENHFELAESISNEVLLNMLPQSPIDSNEISLLATDEEQLRTGKITSISTTYNSPTTQWMVGLLNQHAAKRQNENRKDLSETSGNNK
jgi:thymidylate synthase